MPCAEVKVIETEHNQVLKEYNSTKAEMEKAAQDSSLLFSGVHQFEIMKINRSGPMLKIRFSLSGVIRANRFARFVRIG